LPPNTTIGELDHGAAALPSSHAAHHPTLALVLVSAQKSVPFSLGSFTTIFIGETVMLFCALWSFSHNRWRTFTTAERMERRSSILSTVSYTYILPKILSSTHAATE
jgi:hypothetical protein